jgi:hypothetical protein
VFRSDDSGAFQFLTGNDVQHVMRAACLGAYPDQTHCLRKTSTSNGLSRIPIESQQPSLFAPPGFPSTTSPIGWKAASVETYLRECHQSIGDVTQKAIAGAAQIAAHAA